MHNRLSPRPAPPLLKKRDVLAAIRAQVAAGTPALEVLEFLLQVWGPGGQEGEDDDRILPRAVLTVAEILQLLRVADRRDSLIMRVLYATGLRASECLGLRWADVNFSNHSLFVRAGKGGFDRYVLADPETLRLLREWRGDRALSERLFELALPTLWRHVVDWAKQTGVHQKYLALGFGVSPHSFRHSFATHCFERGMPDAVLQTLLGHTTLESTVYYVHSSLDFCRRAYAASHVLSC